MTGENYVIEKFDPLYRDGSKIRTELEDQFSDGLDTVAHKMFGTDARGVAQDPQSLAKVTTGAIVYNALKNEGEDQLAEEYIGALAMRAKGEKGGSEFYLDAVNKIKDKQILQSKYNIQDILTVEKTMEALAKTGKFTKSVAENQVKTYATTRVSTETAQAMALASELGQTGVSPLNAYLGGNAAALGIGYFDAQSPQELAQKGANLAQTKIQIDQTLEGRVV